MTTDNKTLAVDVLELLEAYDQAVEDLSAERSDGWNEDNRRPQLEADVAELRAELIAALAARQPGDFDDKELQFYREHIGNDLDNMLMGAGVFEVTHEGGYEACWANSMDALKRLIDRKPVEFERAIPTRRRESAVELLLSLGFVWNNQRWEDRRQPVGEVVVTKNDAGQIVAVTRQDDEHRILSVIAESAPAQAVGTVLGGEFHYITPKHGLPDGTKLYAKLGGN